MTTMGRAMDREDEVGATMKRAITLSATLLLFFALRANGQQARGANSPGDDERMMVVTPAGARPATLGTADHFTGNVRVTPMFQATGTSRASGASVTFEPGARSAWHTHPLGQTLIVTSGTGWIQQAGAAKREIREGDVIWTPPGVKHWHGATATSAVTHIAIQESLHGKVVEWMEHVSDEQYRSPVAESRQPAGAPPGFPGSQPVRSPEVSPDGAVTFRLRAPGAREVSVRGITPQPVALQKGDQGVWSVTTSPLKPDLYSYSFLVDGLTIADPSNRRTRPAYYGVSESSVLVPGDNLWTPRAVERGTVARHFFRSGIAGDDRQYLVYTPAGYDPARKEPYPVIYLLHGLFDDADAWTQVGAANVILDNLIAQGKAEPMIMVNTLGYGNADGPAGHLREDMLPNFGRILLEEVLPRVESGYNVSKQPAGRAIAGLSMGGAEATLIGLNHLDSFAWVGSFSGAYNLWPLTRPKLAPPPAGESPAEARERFRRELVLDVVGLPRSFPSLDAGDSSKLRLLWIACGTDDVLIGVNRQFKKYVDEQRVKVTYAEVPGIGHVWPFWRQSLAEFVPLLFR
jgi:enterochelin esterase family protein